MKRSIGFIGLGTMGQPMARNLLKGGFPLTVYDVTKKAVDELAGLGAHPGTDPRAVAQASEVVIVMVRDAAQVQEALLGDRGVMEGIQRGSTIIIMSTIEPMAVKSLVDIAEKRKVKLIDAPVARGEQAAIEGTLIIYVGGDQQVLEDCREILEIMGKDIIYCGELGSGEVVKVINNYITLNSTLIYAEAMVLGVKCGIEPKRLVELMVGGFANSIILQNVWAPKVLKGNFKPGFSMENARKDIGLAMAMAEEAKIPVAMGSQGYQIFQAECAAGKGESDFTSAVTTLEKLAKVEIRG